MLKIFYLILITAISIYFVVGGIADTVIFEKYLDAEKALSDSTFTEDAKFRNLGIQRAVTEHEKLNNFYPTYNLLGPTMSTIITLICFGILGSIIRLLLFNLLSGTRLVDSKIYTISILGGIVGLLSIVLTFLLPEFKYDSGEDRVNYTFALLCGIFTKELFNWLEEKFKSMLPSQANTK